MEVHKMAKVIFIVVFILMGLALLVNLGILAVATHFIGKVW